MRFYKTKGKNHFKEINNVNYTQQNTKTNTQKQLEENNLHRIKDKK